MLKDFTKYLGRFALVNLAAFLFFYISGYILINDALEYVRYFIGEAIDFALPVITASLLAVATVKHGFRALWLGVAAAIGRLIYYYPVMYLEFVGAQNLNSIDSLIVSVPFSIGFVLLELIFSMLLVFIIHLIGEKLAQKHGNTFGGAIESAVSPFDFSNEFTVAVFIAGIIPFIFTLAIEISDVVTFLSEYSDNYQMGEIIYISVSFIMILLQFLATHFLIFKIKNHKSRKGDF